MQTATTLMLLGLQNEVYGRHNEYAEGAGVFFVFWGDSKRVFLEVPRQKALCVLGSRLMCALSMRCEFYRNLNLQYQTM